ncbi:hypothetical protein HPP92_028735 [Vanilla planifolia]|uniref:Uncharacterized protein n=1 Tax=Vanilla planifolia TaxID=51239 RepID=A0A835P4Q2_VANPL|nr:hypothetical protein HPP92_028735 [Vanilla planifolia]KAG0446681.1 hypothetical protein HPP92_028723 [Vanilla planifolia]
MHGNLKPINACAIQAEVVTHSWSQPVRRTAASVVRKRFARKEIDNLPSLRQCTFSIITVEVVVRMCEVGEASTTATCRRCCSSTNYALCGFL